MVCINLRDPEGLLEESMDGKSFGFTGKQVIHPSQIATVNHSYSPSIDEIRWAREICNKYLSDPGQVGAFIHDHIVIDQPGTGHI